MADQYSDEDEDESGSTLRRRLEETLDKNRELSSELSGLKAQAIVQEHGYSLVKPEDLDGVTPDEMIERAEAVQQERLGERDALARDILSNRGLSGSELDQAVNDFLTPSESDTSAYSRAKETSAIGGSAAPLRDPRSLHGLDAIEYALGQKDKGR